MIQGVCRYSLKSWRRKRQDLVGEGGVPGGNADNGDVVEAAGVGDCGGGQVAIEGVRDNHSIHLHKENTTGQPTHCHSNKGH